MVIMLKSWIGGAVALGMTLAAARGEETAVTAGQTNKLSGSLFVYCAGGVKEPVSEIAKKFEADTGVKVELTFANSGQLLGQIETTKIGDVYIPGHGGRSGHGREDGHGGCRDRLGCPWPICAG